MPAIRHPYGIILHIDWPNQEWQCNLYDIYQPYNPKTLLGTIDGLIEKHQNKTCFIINNSFIDDSLQGKGIGEIFYIMLIEKVLSLGDFEIRSSQSRNDFSRGLWKGLEEKYVNITSNKKYHKAYRLNKNIL